MLGTVVSVYSADIGIRSAVALYWLCNVANLIMLHGICFRMSVGVSLCLPFTLMSESHLHGLRYLNAFHTYNSAMFLSCEVQNVLFLQ